MFPPSSTLLPIIFSGIIINASYLETGRAPEALILAEIWPKKPTGRRVVQWRKMLNPILFRMRSGRPTFRRPFADAG
jgi:hypothetical protein